MHGNSSSKAPISTKSHYWLVAGQVVFSDGENEGRQNLNTLLATPQGFVSQTELGKAQKVLQVRLINEVFGGALPENIKITDVFLMSVSNLGYMNEKQFTAGFAEMVEGTRQAEHEQAIRDAMANAQTVEPLLGG